MMYAVTVIKHTESNADIEITIEIDSLEVIFQMIEFAKLNAEDGVEIEFHDIRDLISKGDNNGLGI